jgi:outer membrane protein TolC
MRFIQHQTLFLTALTALLIATPVASAETFESYLQRLRQHPQVESILAESEALKAQAEGELGLPDPMFMIGVDNVPISDPAFDRFLPTSKVIGLSQSIPNPAVRKAKAARYEQISEKQKILADYTNARLHYMLISQLAEYESVKTQTQLISKQLDYYKELESTFKGQIEAGRPMYQRFSEIDVERAEAERKLNDLNARQTSIEAEFIRLIDNIPKVNLPNIPDLLWDENATTLYPVMIAAKQIDIAKKDVSIAHTAFLPNFGINAVYKQRQDGANGTFAGDDWFSLQAQVTIPLWASSNQKPKLKAATERERSAKFSYDDVRRFWQKQMKSLQSNRDAAAKNIKVLLDKDHAMKKKIDAVQRNYEAGSANLDSVLLARIDRLNIQAQLAATKEKHISLSAEFNSNIIGAYNELTLQEAPE